MTSFIVLCVAIAVAYIGVGYYWARFEHRLREQPPERVWLKLSLGRGMSESEKKMLRFLRTFAKELRASGGQRRRGERQLRLVAVAERDHPDAQPVIKTYIACDPQMADAVRGALREQFGTKLGIQEVEDPLAAYRSLPAVPGPEDGAPAR
jgi:hypothetical protein